MYIYVYIYIYTCIFELLRSSRERRRVLRDRGKKLHKEPAVDEDGSSSKEELAMWLHLHETL